MHDDVRARFHMDRLRELDREAGPIADFAQSDLRRGCTRESLAALSVVRLDSIWGFFVAVPLQRGSASDGAGFGTNCLRRREVGSTIAGK
jgi:hypothetical protein